MKSIFTAAALSLLAVSAAHASGIASAEASELRQAYSLLAPQLETLRSEVAQHLAHHPIG